MKKTALLLATLLALAAESFAFCGFYVAKADASLFNTTSQIIITRYGQRSVITMSNDFQGEVADFAMVVPVPEVLKREQIRVVENDLFSKLDAYSGPRLVEYWDPEPCYNEWDEEFDDFDGDFSSEDASGAELEQNTRDKKQYGVEVKARYDVGEYDVIILDAERSSGLEDWLVDNGYKIPKGAKEALHPYIRDKMKFFVVKVDLKEVKSQQEQIDLRPLQIEFNSPKFMLPIRLGMANANGDQDMLVYVLTQNGQTEVMNYRTVKVPTDRNIPLFLKQQNMFGEMYRDLFNRNYEHEGKSAVFLEYAWDISGNAGVKCDPCVGPPPIYTDLQKSGVNWLTLNQNGTQYMGSVFFTRLHVRYNRRTFPQDLIFSETPNRQRFQGRYVMHNPPYYNDFSCEEGQQYLINLRRRRKVEIEELAALTGWNPSQFRDYVTEYDKYLKQGENVRDDGVAYGEPGTNPPPAPPAGIPALILIVAAALLLVWLARRLRPKPTLMNA